MQAFEEEEKPKEEEKPEEEEKPDEETEEVQEEPPKKVMVKHPIVKMFFNLP